jgi:glycerol-3-phosphate dehydrogenase
MQTITTEALVIGGGATGTGCARDLAMRGIRCILVEKGDLTHGTTGRYHGLLHSGGRYVTSDPQSASECARENAVLRRIMPHCIEDTSGFFVTTEWDDPDYADLFKQNCRKTGVPALEIDPAEALRREPALNPRLSRVFEVYDGAADSFLAAHANVLAAREYGAVVFTYHQVVGLIREQDRIVAAIVEDKRSGERTRIEARIILNASGAWAGQIAAMAGLTVTVLPGKGTMVAMNQRMVNTVINRCKYPADGDILVPIRSVAVIGTTDVQVSDPDVYTIEPEEVRFMLEEGAKLVPDFAHYRALRAWAGVRPLYKDVDVADNREIPRTFKILDHAERDGVAGMLSIVGGKWTTYRLMAEEIVDAAAAILGNTRTCRTHEEALPIPASEGELAPRSFWAGRPLADVEQDQRYGELICECELVTRERVENAIADGAVNLDDVRRDVRMGMGPCQGGWCIYRTLALLFEQRVQPGAPEAFQAAHADAALLHFLQERWRGLLPVLWGDQLRQARLDGLIYESVLGAAYLREIAAAGGGLVTRLE